MGEAVMPEDLSIADVIAKLRRAAAERQRPCPAFSFQMQWLKQQIIATVDAGRSDPILRYDIAHLVGRHQRDFDEGWRKPWLPDNAFYWARIREPDGMTRLLEGWWPWDVRRN